MASNPKRFLTPDEYLAIEHDADQRSEYSNVRCSRWSAPLWNTTESLATSLRCSCSPFAHWAAAHTAWNCACTLLPRFFDSFVVIQRAQVLATLSRPELAFTGNPQRWQTANFTGTVHQWRQDLLSFKYCCCGST